LKKYTIGEKPQSRKEGQITITRDWLEYQLRLGYSLETIAYQLGITRKALFKIRKKLGMEIRNRKHFKKDDNVRS